MKQASAFGVIMMMCFLVCAILAKHGLDGYALSGLGLVYEWVIEPICHGLMLIIRALS